MIIEFELIVNCPNGIMSQAVVEAHESKIRKKPNVPGISTRSSPKVFEDVK
jgi:hypothetical protein